MFLQSPLSSQEVKLKISYNLIVDSGTSYFTIPNTVVNQMIHLMKSSQINCTLESMLIRCSHLNANDYPDIKLVVNNTAYFIPKKSYVACNFYNCTLRILVYPGIDMFILGLNFLQNYYTVFDYENKRVGFALSTASDVRIPMLVLSSNSYIIKSQTNLDYKQN